MKLRPASPRNEILATLGRFRPALRSVALFTAVINLLMLAPSLYMLQVYDRVLGSGNHMTLLMLTLMVLGLYLLLGALEWVRSLVVIRLGGQLDMQLNQRIYDASFRASLERGEQAVGQALNDLASLRQFLTGNALFAFFDAPWFPLYLLVIFLFSPWLGLLALVGALLLVLLAWVNESRSREPLAEAGQLSILATQQASANLRQAETLAAMGMLPAMRALVRPAPGLPCPAEPRQRAQRGDRRDLQGRAPGPAVAGARPRRLAGGGRPDHPGDDDRRLDPDGPRAQPHRPVDRGLAPVERRAAGLPATGAAARGESAGRPGHAATGAARALRVERCARPRRDASRHCCRTSVSPWSLAKRSA